MHSRAIPIYIGLVTRLILLILLLALPAPAFANSPARIKAREHFERGETQYRLGRFTTALKEYQAALKLVRRPSIVFNIAQCYRQLSEYRRSIFYYKLYLSDWQRVHPGQKPPYQREVKEHIRKLTAAARRKAAEQDGPGVSEPPGPAAARVQLDGAPDGARVFVDGVLVARTPLEVPLQLTPGQHRLEVVARGSAPWVQNIQLSGREQRRVMVDLEPERGKRDKTYLAIGVPAAAMAVGMEIMALVAMTEGNKRKESDPDINTYKTLNIVGHVGAGLFAAGSITCFVLYYLSDDGSGGSTARLQLSPLQGGGYVGGSFRF